MQASALVTTVGSALLVLTVNTASAQGPIENAIEMYAESDFYLFDESSVHVIDYETARDVRICADTRQHDIPLRVDYDDKTTTVRPGDCFSFEAKQVSIEAAGDLEPNLDLAGTIEHRGRR